MEIGPEAGSGGGRLLYSGPIRGLLAQDTHTGRAFSGREVLVRPEGRSRGVSPGGPFVRIRGAAARNLAGIDVDIPFTYTSYVSKPSGSRNNWCRTRPGNVTNLSSMDGQYLGPTPSIRPL